MLSRLGLESLKLDGQAWTTCEKFDDGRALLTAICELGFEGVVAKKHSSLYRPNYRGWVKVKNPDYCRRDACNAPASDGGRAAWSKSI
jgi:ATP-dependent DNA ligase